MQVFPYLLFSDKTGKIFSHPYLRMAAASGRNFIIPAYDDLFFLVKNITYFSLPGRLPVGYNPNTKNFEVLKTYAGQKVWAVAAFLPPGYVRLSNPAYAIAEKKELPMWAYTACGFYKGKFVAAVTRVDKRVRQSPSFYDCKTVKFNVRRYLKQYPRNRLYKHLSYCALNYNCLAAKNLFMNRWEGPLPTAMACNARCAGCLSFQKNRNLASHSRIEFNPTTQEIVQVIVNHLSTARRPLISFGQGCEGEPLLGAEFIASAIVQAKTKLNGRGTINMNTNASLSDKIELLCKAGMDSFRVSLNSAQKKYYEAYFKPIGYKFEDVLESIAVMKQYKKFISLNVFVFPGFTDSFDEAIALKKLVRDKKIDAIQWRNFNIDPDKYMELIKLKPRKCLGIKKLIADFAQAFPNLKMGYFNLTKEEFNLSGHGQFAERFFEKGK